MKKTLIAVDDEPLALVLLEKYIKRLNGWELKGTFIDSLTALDFLEANEIDVILTDINMPDMNGLDFVHALPTQKRPLVIFITAYKEHALESYDLDILDYMVKPVSFERFEKALSKAEEWITMKSNLIQDTSVVQNDYLLVYSQYQLMRINLHDIQYIQSMGDYVKIHLDSSSKPVVTLERLKNIESKLKNKKFVRIHRSYVVNVDKLISLQKSKVRIGSVWLPVSPTYYRNIEIYRKEY